MKFSIRDLMLKTVIAAVCAAWWVDRSRLRSETRELELRLTLKKELEEATTATARARRQFEVALAEAAKAAAQSQAEANRMLEETGRNSWSDDSSEGPVRGYTLLGPPVPSSSAPAANPPKN